MEELAALLGFRFSSVELADAMDVMDEDNSGQVNFEEFFNWWKERHERGDLEIHNEAVGVFNRIDADGNGQLVPPSPRMLRHLCCCQHASCMPIVGQRRGENAGSDARL